MSRFVLPRVLPQREILRRLLVQQERALLRLGLSLRAIDDWRALLHLRLPLLECRWLYAPRLIVAMTESCRFPEIHQLDRCLLVDVQLSTDLPKESTHRLWLAPIASPTKSGKDPLTIRPNIRGPDTFQLWITIGVLELAIFDCADLRFDALLPCDFLLVRREDGHAA